MTADRLGWRELVGYALPAVPTAALALPLTVYVAPFYAVQIGLGTGLVGILFFLVRAIDIAFDPLIGLAQDRTETRWGRRRPWLVAITPPMLGAVFLFFDPPAQASALYLATCLVAIYFGFSVLTIGHTAWGAELTGAYHERSRITAARQIAFVCGMLVALVLPSALELRFAAGAREKVAAMGWFIMAGLPLAVGMAVFLAGEPRHAPPIGDGIDALWRRLRLSPALRSVLGVDLAIGLATSITASLYLFLVEETFALPHSSTLLLCYFAAGLAGMPIWTRLSYRFGKHRTLAGAALCGALTLPFFLLVPRNGTGSSGALALTVLFGLSYGAGPLLLHAIMGDVADQETAETGERRAGAAFALLTLTTKIGYALSVGITYPLLDLVGFSGRAGATNTPQALTAILLVFVGLPAALLTTAAAALWRFPLDEREHLRLRAQIALAARHASAADSAKAEGPSQGHPDCPIETYGQ
jgi:glycoside/pentoside/hexuronide:cation symporter, GPH family